MKLNKNNLIRYLKTYCYGKANAMSKDRLARYFNITTRELRKLKREIVLIDGIPIGSTEQGYYYSDLDEDLDSFAAIYKSRGLKEFAMFVAYRRIKKNRKTKQLELAV